MGPVSASFVREWWEAVGLHVASCKADGYNGFGGMDCLHEEIGTEREGADCVEHYRADWVCCGLGLGERLRH